MRTTIDSGRICPIDYHYTAHSLSQTPALETIESLAADENAHCVFNGDFNWFNCTPSDFSKINNAVLKYSATRGNVETEIARTPFAGGCGCGYPDDVSDNTVAWSNDIIELLHKASADAPTLLNNLRQLPTTKRYQVAELQIQVVHGDLTSLAGWTLSRSSLNKPSNDTVQNIVDTSADIIACTHTCEPYAVTLNSSKSPCVVINNGAAGMPNFKQVKTADSFGIITRIATTPAPGNSLYQSKVAGVHIDAIAVHYDQAKFLDWFEAIWNPESAAYLSYFDRIKNGIDLSIADAIGHGFSATA